MVKVGYEIRILYVNGQKEIVFINDHDYEWLFQHGIRSDYTDFICISHTKILPILDTRTIEKMYI